MAQSFRLYSWGKSSPELTVREYLHIIFSPRFWAAFLIGVFLYLIFDPLLFGAQFSQTRVILTLSSAGLVYVTLQVSLVLLFMWINTRFDVKIPILQPVFGIPSSFIALWFLLMMTDRDLGLPPPMFADILAHWPMSYLRIQILEAIVFHLAINPLAAAAKAKSGIAHSPLDEDADEATEQQGALIDGNLIHIGPKSVPLADLCVIKAEGHFLRVVTDSETFSQRARLSDVLVQFPDNFGLRPHRSWWVARRWVVSVERHATGGTIRTHCGMEVPIARGRLSLFDDFVVEA